MSTCYVCGKIIDFTNRTEEHIIPNAIGGHLKSPYLICYNCNCEFGRKIDAALAQQLNPIASMLNIKRDRGTPQAFDTVDTKNGTTYSFEPGGKPVLKIPDIQQDGNHYTIKVRDKKQARTVLSGLKRKHPEIDIETILQNCKPEKKYIENFVSIDFVLGGSEAFRSLCKTAINFYLYKGGNKQNICHLIPYIKNDAEDLHIVSPMYFDKAPIPTRPEEVLHSIIVRGDVKEKMLFAYIELFDFYKVVVLLNKNYEGEAIEYSYFFDVLQRVQVSRNYELKLSKKQVENVLNGGKFTYQEMHRKMKPYLEEVIRKAQQRQDAEHLHELLDTAMENARQKIEGGNLTEDEMREIVINETLEQVTPWVLHMLKRPER